MTGLLAYMLWHSPQLWPLAVALSALVVAAAVWLYKPQVRAAGGVWRWLLPSLRAAALVALVLSVVKPVAVRPKTAREQGAVLILVDRSRSMSVNDASRSGQQLVALADGIGRLDAKVRWAAVRPLTDRLDQLLSRCEQVARAAGELDYAKLSGRGVEEAQARLDELSGQYKSAATALASEAASAGASVPALLGPVEELQKIGEDFGREPWVRQVRARIEQIRDALAAAQASRDSELYQSNVEVRQLCDQLAKLSRFALVEQALTRPESGLIDRLPLDAPLYGFAVADDAQPFALRSGQEAVRRLMLEPSGTSTNLTACVREAMDRLKGQPLRAVVLFSDGRQVGGDVTVTSALSASGAPIFAVPAAAPAASRDVSVVRVVLPSSAFVDETITVRAELKGVGVNGAAADVELETDSGKQTQRVTFVDEQVVGAEFKLKLEKPGQKIVVRVAPADGEIGVENNQASRWVKVLSDKVKIAALAGPPTWDFQYLRNALSRSAWVELQDFILDSDGKLTFPAEQLLAQDLIVLCDVAVASLDAAQWDAVHRLVSERNGSVILMAGNSHLPGEYSRHVLLSSLLPYWGDPEPAWRVWPGEEPFFHLVPAAGTETIDALSLVDDSAASKTRWQQLPGMFRFLPIPQLKPNTRALLVERDSQSPVLTESRLGLGRVLFVGADETWRWRYKIGERDQDRFWLQLIRYAADEPYSVRQGRFSLDAEKVQIEPNQPLRVRARVLDEAGLPVKAAMQEVQILQDGKNIRTETLSAVGAAGSGRFETQITDLAAGQYQLRLVTGESASSGPVFDLHVTPSLEREMVDLSGDEKLLRRLAESSGGQLVLLEQLDKLPEKIAASHQTRSRMVEYALWDSPYLFLFVLGCLGGEWALRKRLGLA